MLTFLLWATMLFAKPEKDILSCSPRELKLRNCTLKQGSLHIEMQKERLRLNDGVWRNLEDEPLKGDVEWQKVRLQKIGKRTFIEFWIWDLPKGEAAVSDLVWIVWEIKGVETIARVQDVIQKRTPKVDGKGYILDKEKAHKIAAGAHGIVKWSSDSLHGEF